MSLSHSKKILFLSILGTCLEFYDFTLFSVFAIPIGRTFFTNADPLISTLAALGAFATGFIMRPVGALVIGYIGDVFGRKQALTLSIFLMSLGPLVLTFLPSYESIGVLAPLIILVLRLLQGFSAGGEFNGAAIYVLERTKTKRKAFFSSFISAAGGLGALLALTMGFILNQSSMPEESFRLAFLLGASIGIVAYLMRIFLPEEVETKTKTKFPLRQILKSHKKSMGLVFFVGALDGTLSYTLVGFLGVYMAQFLGLELSYTFALSMVSLVFYLILTPSMAYFYDRFGSRQFFRSYFLLSLLLVPLVFLFIQTKSTYGILFGQSLMALVLAGFSGTQHAYSQKLFPKELRYTGVSFSYNLGTCLLGGTAPMTLTYLLMKTGDLNLPIYYILGLMGILIFLMSFKNSFRSPDPLP